MHNFTTILSPVIEVCKRCHHFQGTIKFRRALHMFQPCKSPVSLVLVLLTIPKSNIRKPSRGRGSQ